MLSARSVERAWVEHEIIAALEHARQSPGRTNLYLIRMDNTVMTTSQRLCRQPTKAEALGIPRQRTGYFSRMRESLALEGCDILRARRDADAPLGGWSPPGTCLLPRRFGRDRRE